MHRSYAAYVRRFKVGVLNSFQIGEHIVLVLYLIPAYHIWDSSLRFVSLSDIPTYLFFIIVSLFCKPMEIVVNFVVCAMGVQLHGNMNFLLHPFYCALWAVRILVESDL